MGSRNLHNLHSWRIKARILALALVLASWPETVTAQVVEPSSMQDFEYSASIWSETYYQSSEERSQRLLLMEILTNGVWWIAFLAGVHLAQGVWRYV